MTEQPEAEPPALPGVTRWRRRDWDVEAIQWTGENFEEVKRFASGALGLGGNSSETLPLWVARFHAVRHVDRGDWIISESYGFRACPAGLFAATYEPAGEPQSADPGDDTSRALSSAVVEAGERTGPSSSERCGTVAQLRRIADEDIGGNAPWLADKLHQFADQLAAEMRGECQLEAVQRAEAAEAKLAAIGALTQDTYLGEDILAIISGGEASRD